MVVTSAPQTPGASCAMLAFSVSAPKVTITPHTVPSRPRNGPPETSELSSTILSSYFTIVRATPRWTAFSTWPMHNVTSAGRTRRPLCRCTAETASATRNS